MRIVKVVSAGLLAGIVLGAALTAIFVIISAGFLLLNALAGACNSV